MDFVVKTKAYARTKMSSSVPLTPVAHLLLLLLNKLANVNNESSEVCGII